MYSYPLDFCEKNICPECGEDTVLMMDDVDGEIYVCPECGEEIHLSKQLPITAEKNMMKSFLNWI